MTKPITGAAMMMLWEEGKWALDDPVARHIPQFEGLKVRRKDGEPVDQASPMTMAQLMSHSAGFGRAAEYADADLRGGDLQDMIDMLAKLPLSFQPGKDWRYGPSVDIQGYLVEQLSGQGLDEFFEQRLFAPLGMTDTGFWVDAAKGDRVSASTSTTTTARCGRPARPTSSTRPSRSSWPAAADWSPRSRTTGASPR